MSKKLCQAKDPASCIDPKCPERVAFFSHFQEYLSQSKSEFSSTKSALQRSILSLVEKESFTQLLSGKEIGHRIADKVDDYLADYIVKNHNGYFEHSNGMFLPSSDPKTIVKRSAGDVWIKDGNRYIPINIKTGVSDTGSPNMVSMNKITNFVESDKIDQYNILYVKFGITDKHKIQTTLRYFNMLDHINLLSYDAGPGQIMLKEAELKRSNIGYKIPNDLVFRYEAEGSEKHKKKVLIDLYSLHETGLSKIIESRKKALQSVKAKKDALNR